MNHSGLAIEVNTVHDSNDELTNLEHRLGAGEIDYAAMDDFLANQPEAVDRRRLLALFKRAAAAENRVGKINGEFWLRRAAANTAYAPRLFAVERALESEASPVDFDPLALPRPTEPKTMDRQVWGAEFENALGRLHGRNGRGDVERILPLLNKIATEDVDEDTHIFLCRCMYGLLAESDEATRRFIAKEHGAWMSDVLRCVTSDAVFTAWSEVLTLLIDHQWAIQKYVVENLAREMSDQRKIALIRLSSVVLSHRIPTHYPYQWLEPLQTPYSRFYRGAARMLVQTPGGERFVHWTLARNYQSVSDVELPIVGGGLQVVEDFLVWCQDVNPEHRAAVFRKACEDARYEI